MADVFDPGPASRVVRLFPLPDVVLFPHTILPLHIFEPRYRQMTEDALARDKTIALVRLKPGNTGAAIEEVGCLGEIVQHQRLPDGRFNILLAGRRRIRLRRDVPSDKLYRVAEGDLLDDEYSDAGVEHRRTELITLCRAVLEREDADLGWLSSSDLPLGVLADVAASAVRLASDIRQTLLAECHVARRVELLLDACSQLAPRANPEAPLARGFPPPFSTN